MAKNDREKTVVYTSVVSILTNFLLVTMKAAVGLMAHSIAIITDAVNNLSDALSSIITIIGMKLAGRAPDREHPYGHGRTEYVTSFIVSAIVLYAGATALIESIKKIINPEEVDYTAVTIIVLVVGIIGKFALGLYVKRAGRKVNSGALIASGTDAFNDGLLSMSVLTAAVIYMLFGVNIEAYAGVLVSIYIIKSGIELIRESVDNMVGKRIESKLSHNIKNEVMREPGVQGAYDLILNDYGPDTYLGSIHIEVPDTMSVAEVDKISRRLTRRIMKKYGVILHTIGVYSINTRDKKVMRIREQIRAIVLAHKEVLQMHGFYLNSEEGSMHFDIIIDFATAKREELYQRIYDEIHAEFPDYKLEIILDIDISD